MQRYAKGVPPGKYVRAGDFVSIYPQHCMSHDNSWPIATKFMGLGGVEIQDTRQVVMALDHDVQNKSEKNLEKYANIEKFAKLQGVDFYPAGRGIGHQIMIEEGYAFPYNMTVASDSHSNMYGGVACLGTPIVRTDAAAIWATGQTWWQIPPVAQVELYGSLPAGVTGKDVIVALCGLFNNDEALNHAIEFVGEGISSLSIDDRLAIANMTTEWGALSGLFPVDARLIDYYKVRASGKSPSHPRINASTIKRVATLPVTSHPEATYAKVLHLNLSSLTPYVSGPNSVKIATPLYTLAQLNINIQKAYLVSCTNSRQSDIASAADVVRGSKVADGVEFYIAAASSEVQADAEKSGDWQALLAAGAIALPAGCGPCIGLGTGLLQDGEVGISATNRNFKGRMGSKEAQAYLASPAVVAASAIAGRIALPPGSPEHGHLPTSKVETLPLKDVEASSALDILDGFPDSIEGEIVFCDADNVNTDGIYPGKYTYQDDIPVSQMAQVCMENYDPSFVSKTFPGDILVSGFNFGTGSSREQAATAILARKIPLVVSGSFGNIFFRNSINNALLTLEIPKLIQRLRHEYSRENKELTRRTGWTLKWDVRQSMVTIVEKDGAEWKQKVGDLGTNLQEIIAKGGLESWVKSQL